MRMDSTVATKMATIVLLTATVFLLADSVAGSRLQSIPANVIQVDSESGTHFITAAAATAGLRGSKSHGQSFAKRTLLQELPPPPPSGDDNNQSGKRSLEYPGLIRTSTPSTLNPEQGMKEFLSSFWASVKPNVFCATL